MAWYYPGYGALHSPWQPVVESHTTTEHAREREREHDTLTHNNHPGENMMVRANIRDSAVLHTLDDEILLAGLLFDHVAMDHPEPISALPPLRSHHLARIIALKLVRVRACEDETKYDGSPATY